MAANKDIDKAANKDADHHMRFSTGELNIICTDMERSLRFYRDVLGFTVVGEEDGAVRLSNDGATFLLLPLAGRPADDAPYGSRAEISFDLEVGDLLAASRHFIANGVAFERPYAEGEPYFVVRDPDGLRIEIVGG